MTNVLIISLGTTPKPIINCIKSLRPDRVVFLCSSESQKMVDEVISEVALPDFSADRDLEVLQQSPAAKSTQSIENELDQLDRVYLRVLKIFKRVRDESRHCQIIADYTGGTKTMTAGLAMAAIDDGEVRLNVTTGKREAAKTPSGHSTPSEVNTAAIHARRLHNHELPLLLKRYDYEAARQAVRRVYALPFSDSQNKQELKRIEDRLFGLDAWDRFDHREALEIFQNLDDPDLRKAFVFPLKRIIASRRLLDKEAQEWPWMPGHGLEAVEDLLRNAERRASQERYDDAVGRFYRAMELTEQLLLKKGVCKQVGMQGIETGSVKIDCLPAPIQEKWRFKAASKTSDSQSIFKIGLTDGFDLLGDLGHPTGLAWQQQRKRLINALSTRNNSLFAHGFKPVDYKGWKDFSGVLNPFLHEAIRQHAATQSGKNSTFNALPQLPNDLSELP